MLPAVAAAALLGTVVVAGVAGGFGDDGAAGGDATTPDGRRTTTTVAVDHDRRRRRPRRPTAPVVKTTLAQTIGEGSSGNDVTMVQQRLKDLGFDPGPIDGQFGGLTRAAVWAFEKLVLQTPRDEATGGSPTRCGSGCRTRSSSSRAARTRRAPTTPRSTCPSRSSSSSSTTSRR